jgi:O-antigen ligase
MISNLILGIGAAATLSIPNGCWLGSVILAVRGLLHREGFRSLLRDADDFRWFLFACLGYAAVNGLLLAYHGEPASSYEYLIPFLIAPLLLNGLRGRALNPNYLFAGFAFAALVAGGLAIDQVLIRGTHIRAVGHIKAIPFGNLSIVGGTVSLMGLLYVPKALPLHMRLLFALGALSGLIASLLSGSKGGWLAVLVVGPIVFYLLLRVLDKKVTLIILLLLVLSAGFAIFCPGSPVLRRLQQTVDSVRQGTLEGRRRDGSLAPRLAVWRYVIEDALWRSPIVGSSRSELAKEQKRVAEEKSAPRMRRALDHYHNELLDTLATKGLVGVGVLALLFLSAFRFFIRRIRCDSPEQRVLGWLGTIVLLEFAVFSLTDIQFQISAVRSMFMFVVISVASLILAEEQRRLASSSSGAPTDAA